MLKRIFYTGIIGISVFEMLNVYFIMPFPGSQEINSLNVAYFLYSHRWFFRIMFGLMIAAGTISAFQQNKKWLAGISLLIMLAIIYIFNFHIAADSMFKQPESLVFRKKADNRVNDSSLVICVYQNGEAKGYPVEFMAYHHQVQDTVGGQPLIITYCSVCRTGRVYEPKVRGYQEKFRLVGMDHFNAMFEDATTKSWWRQATGEAVTGPLKGDILAEIESMQLTVAKLFDLFPSAFVMQQDEASVMKYDSLRRFERGLSSNSLTYTDSLSWKKKSWVIGIQTGSKSKAYDWNQLKEKQIINDKIGEIPIVIILSSDNNSFAAFERPNDSDIFTIRNDSLFVDETAYDLAGNCLTSSTDRLKRVKAFQEFWHSWQTFHPDSERYQ